MFQMGHIHEIKGGWLFNDKRRETNSFEF